MSREIISLYYQGFSINQIAYRSGQSRSDVVKAIADANLPLTEHELGIKKNAKAHAGTGIDHRDRPKPMPARDVNLLMRQWPRPGATQ